MGTRIKSCAKGKHVRRPKSAQLASQLGHVEVHKGAEEEIDTTSNKHVSEANPSTFTGTSATHQQVVSRCT